MSEYIRKNWETNNIISADDLNRMEEGIVEAQRVAWANIPYIGKNGNWWIGETDTGVKAEGMDYVLTEADKNEIAALVAIKIIDEKVIGTIDENNNILLSGNLADGSYTLKYENEDGTYTEIGTLEIGAIPEPEPAFTNFADTTNSEWKNGYRLTTTIDQVTALTGGAATNYISIQTGDIVEVSGINFVDSNNRQAANGSFGGIAKAEIMQSTYGQYFGDVTFDSNNLKFTVLGDMTQMRFSGLLTGTSNDVVVKITRNGTLL